MPSRNRLIYSAAPGSNPDGGAGRGGHTAADMASRPGEHGEGSAGAVPLKEQTP